MLEAKSCHRHPVTLLIDYKIRSLNILCGNDFDEAVTGSYSDFVSQMTQTKPGDCVIMYHTYFLRLALIFL